MHAQSSLWHERNLHVHSCGDFPPSSAAYAHREGITGDQLKVDVADILSYNAELANYVLDNPTESLPLVHSPSLDILRKVTSFRLVTTELNLR